MSFISSLSVMKCFRSGADTKNEPKTEVGQSSALHADSIASKKESERMTIGDAQLAGYHALRSLDGKTVEQEIARPARKANQVMAGIRKEIIRGNCTPEYLSTKGKANNLVHTIRQLTNGFPKNSKNAYYQHTSACIEDVKAANCGEMATVTQHRLGNVLGTNELVGRVSHKNVDHAFTVYKLGPEGNNQQLIVDAWAKGPVVHAEDSAYGANSQNVTIDHLYDKDRGKDAYAETKKIQQWMSADPQYLESKKNIIADQPWNTMDPSVMAARKLWDHTSVLDSNKIVSTTIKHNGSPGFRQQIARAGAVVNMGGNVKDAAWFANRNAGFEHALLHEDFPDANLNAPAYT